MGKLSTPISLIILGFVWLVILVNFVNFGVWMFSERGLPLFPEIFGSFVILFSVYIGICWYNLFMGKSWARTSLITITSSSPGVGVGVLNSAAATNTLS